MKKQFTRKLRSFIFLCLFCFVCAQVCFAQTDRVLVNGNPALKQSHVDRLREYFEWLFEAGFSAAERDEFQKLVVRKWQSDAKESAGILEVLKTYDQIQALSESDRSEVRARLLPKLLDSFRSSDRPSEVNRFLIGVYENGRTDSAVADGQNASKNDGSATIDDLAGTWSSGGVSGERYKNLASGDLSDASGNMSEYIISPNGEIQYTGYLSNTIYACTTRLFFTKKGQISVSGSFITFDYKTGERDYQNSCNASLGGVKPIPPQKKTVAFTLERDAQGVRLCTTDEGVQTCLRKVN